MIPDRSLILGWGVWGAAGINLVARGQSPRPVVTRPAPDDIATPS